MKKKLLLILLLCLVCAQPGCYFTTDFPFFHSGCGPYFGPTGSSLLRDLSGYEYNRCNDTVVRTI